MFGRMKRQLPGKTHSLSVTESSVPPVRGLPWPLGLAWSTGTLEPAALQDAGFR